MHLMRKTELRTPESIALDFTLAGIGNRALALGIDYTVLSLGLTAFLAFLNGIAEPTARALAQLNLDSDTLMLWVLAIAFLILFVFYVGYFAISEALWQGQTIGKHWVKIRVIQDNGRPIGLAQATLRALLRPIDDLFMLGLCFIVLGQREKRIGDWVAGTLVIQEEETWTTPITIQPQAIAVANQLRLELNLNLLTPEDLTVVIAFLQRRSQLSDKARVQVSHRLAQETLRRLNLEVLPPDVTEEQWLEALYHLMQQHDPNSIANPNLQSS